jgi:hypothetical protein
MTISWSKTERKPESLSIALNILGKPTPRAYQNTVGDANDGICCLKSTPNLRTESIGILNLTFVSEIRGQAGRECQILLAESARPPRHARVEPFEERRRFRSPLTRRPSIFSQNDGLRRVKPGTDDDRDVSSIDCDLTSFRDETIAAGDRGHRASRPFPAAFGVLTGRLRAAWSL